MRPKSHADIAQTVTDLIVAKLEQGVKPWQRGWTSSGQGRLPLKHDGTPYRGISTLALWAAGDDASFRSAYWMTARQADDLGARVHPGERAAISIYFNKFRKDAINPATGASSSRLISFASRKGYGDMAVLKASHRNALLSCSDVEIVLAYNAELRGFANCYALARDVKFKLNRLEFIQRWSMFKTLASKHKSSVRVVAARMRSGRNIASATSSTASLGRSKSGS